MSGNIVIKVYIDKQAPIKGDDKSLDTLAEYLADVFLEKTNAELKGPGWATTTIEEENYPEGK